MTYPTAGITKSNSFIWLAVAVVISLDDYYTKTRLSNLKCKLFHVMEVVFFKCTSYSVDFEVFSCIELYLCSQ